MEDQLEVHLRARAELLWMPTMEEDRTAGRIQAVAEKLGHAVFEWTCASGFQQRSQGKLRLPGDGQCTNVDQALRAAGDYKQQRTVILFRDVDLLAARLTNSPDYALLVRRVKDVSRALRQNGNTIIFLASSTATPQELGDYLTLVEVGLPDQAERVAIINTWVATNCQGLPSQASEEQVHQLGSVSAGMTSKQLQSALSVTVVKRKGLTLQRDLGYKP